MGSERVVSIADLEEREIFPGDHLNVYQSPRDPLLPKTGRMPWGDLPSQMATEVIPNAALFRTAGPGDGSPGGGAGGHPSRNDVMYPITTPEEARRAVQDYVKTKPEFVKIWVDDRNGKLPMGTLTPPLYRAVIEEARRLGFDTAAHTVTLADAKELYKAGMVGAVHIPVRGGDHPDEEFLAIIRDRVAKSDRPLWFQEHGSSTALGPEAWDDPLLWEMLERDQVMDQQGAAIKRMTPEAVARARQSSKAIGDDAKKLIGAGMKLVYGSDNGAAGRGFGWYQQLRFENWVSMGFTPAEAIVMVTRDGAQVAKLNTGMVATGKSADFIVLDANPLENIANTRRINKVYLRGAEVDRAGIRAKWQAKWGKWRTQRNLSKQQPLETVNSEGGPMRRLCLITLAATATAALLVFQSSSAANLHAQSAFAGVATAGGNASDLRGGPNGVVKTVLRGTELPVDGLMVQLISHKTSIRTTVYTNERGQFEFPKLESGDYALRIPGRWSSAATRRTWSGLTARRSCPTS